MSNKPRSRDAARRAKNARRAVCCQFELEELDYMKSRTSPHLKDGTAVAAYVRDRIDAERGARGGGM